jgi:hypothetical protein
MFAAELFRYILWALIFGGFLSLASLVWRWSDYTYVMKNIGGYLSGVKYIVVRIYPPAVNQTSIAEMEAFFTRLSVVYGPKDPIDFYVDGTWHTTFSFEIHAKDGRIGLYCRLNAAHLSLLKSSMTSSFPGSVVETVDDPFAHFPENYDNTTGAGGYPGMVGVELSYKGGEKLLADPDYSNDILPLKTWRDFQRDERTAPIADPIVQLFSILQALKPGVYAIIQYVCTPYAREDTSTKVKEKWKKQMVMLKAKFSEESSYELGEDKVRTPLVTEQEKNILNQISRKISGQIYKVKIRIAIFQQDNNNKSIYSEIMSFFESWAGDIVGLAPVRFAKTWDKDSGARFGVLGPWFANVSNQVYWKLQSDFQRKVFYQGLIGREMSKISNARYYSIETLAGLFHFPITNEKTPLQNQMAEQMADGFGDSGNIAVGGSTPNDLPT